MRVVGGIARGRHLLGPKGRETRPTSDKVREAIFDMIGNDLGGERVLDLFAGTGALGIEALSRGASEAIFVERSSAACRVIRANLEATGLTDGARLVCQPVERALSEPYGVFDLILLDPPYAYADVARIMSRLGESPLVGDETAVVFEHSSRLAVDNSYARLGLERDKVYGDTAVSIFVSQEDTRA
ncbi:MAG: 16S rRNA (guanine(966)-N(2))-methyltransferase RsmD [Chloroflexota bacterium]